jgi:ABC-type branched-subunit amino acid transport system substrate-binding protein
MLHLSHSYANSPKLTLFAANSLTLAVLIPTSNASRSIRASVGAVSLATNAINRNGSLLAGRRLEFIIKEVACDSSDAMAKISEALEEKKIAAVIGPDCSLACESTAYLTAGRKTVQISYACNSPLLSDKSKYPMVIHFFSFMHARWHAHAHAPQASMQVPVLGLIKASSGFAVCEDNVKLFKLGSGHR